VNEDYQIEQPPSNEYYETPNGDEARFVDPEQIVSEAPTRSSYVSEMMKNIEEERLRREKLEKEIIELRKFNENLT